MRQQLSRGLVGDEPRAQRTLDSNRRVGRQTEDAVELCQGVGRPAEAGQGPGRDQVRSGAVRKRARETPGLGEFDLVLAEEVLGGVRSRQ
jgi:hypothetical protein